MPCVIGGYPIGVTVPKAGIETLRITHADFHGEWKLHAPSSVHL
jgi:hypothetical protein